MSYINYDVIYELYVFYKTLILHSWFVNSILFPSCSKKCSTCYIIPYKISYHINTNLLDDILYNSVRLKIILIFMFIITLIVGLKYIRPNTILQQLQLVILY